ncbi:MAG: hypothetical protein R3D63_13220 [Paracoccaceae bacterium]
MTGQAALVILGPQGPRIVAPRPLPLDALLLGKPVAEAALLLPRLFNLCRVAQATAARLALGLPVEDADTAAEVVRDHLVKLCVTLRHAFALPVLAMPADPLDLFGEARRLPAPEALARWLTGPAPAAELAARIARDFAFGTACCEVLPAPAEPLQAGACENSAAGRQAAQPLMRAIEASHGRGPLWRYIGMLADLQAAVTSRLAPARARDGVAVVAAARGDYALRLTQAGGLVTGIFRRTPTDHLLAPGGALEQALRRLPADLRHLAPRVVALHDPCVPVTVEEAQHA